MLIFIWYQIQTYNDKHNLDKLVYVCEQCSNIQRRIQICNQYVGIRYYIIYIFRLYIQIGNGWWHPDFIFDRSRENFQWLLYTHYTCRRNTDFLLSLAAGMYYYYFTFFSSFCLSVYVMWMQRIVSSFQWTKTK